MSVELAHILEVNILWEAFAIYRHHIPTMRMLNHLGAPEVIICM
jgi:hypothetical protein